MIKSITSGPGITIINTGVGAWPYISSSASQDAGRVRYNSNNQCLEVFDGNMWQLMLTGSGQPIIELDGRSQAAIDWVHNRIVEESNWCERAKTNQTLADAVEALRLAEEQVRMIAILTKV